MDVFFDYNSRSNKATIRLSDEDVRDRLMEYFSVVNEAKRFFKGPGSWRIPDRLYFISPTGSFNYGLAEIIISWLKQYVFDRTINFNFTDTFKEKYFPKENKNLKIVHNLAFEPRDYQKDCVNLALRHKFGTFVLGTGAGKTFTIASIINNLFVNKLVKKVLIIVPDNGLVLQFFNELTSEYKLPYNISCFYDKVNTIDKNADIIIANRPLFLSRFSANEKYFRDKVDCLIVDEAHSIKRNNKISKHIEKMRAEYKFGFTGTLAENREDRIKCLGNLGPVRYEKTSKELRDGGFLTKVTVSCIQLDYNEQFNRSRKYREEITLLQTLDKRNEFLTKLLFKLEKNTLILVNFLAHGFELERIFKEFNEKNNLNRTIVFIRGEVETEIREEFKKLMEKENGIICIAITKIFSTGINIKNLHNIVLAAGGKSSVTVVQAIGRGLRLHPDKKELRIFDISDKGYLYSQRHAEKRKQIYSTEKIPIKEVVITL